MPGRENETRAGLAGRRTRVRLAELVVQPEKVGVATQGGDLGSEEGLDQHLVGYVGAEHLVRPLGGLRDLAVTRE